MFVVFARAIFALFYAYGAFVHVLNITGQRGFDWAGAPLKWQVLDVAYLAVDLIVVAGLLLRPRIGFAVLVLAAVSQILLYTVFRDWILDVPREYRLLPSQIDYLNNLLIFHGVSIGVVVTGLLLGLRADGGVKSDEASG